MAITSQVRSDIAGDFLLLRTITSSYVECSLREVISGKSQRIIEEAVFLTPPAFCIIFAGSSRVFVVEQFGIWRWKANEKTNLQ